MSKFSKFITNPKLFFIDAYRNVMDYGSSKSFSKQKADDFNLMLPIKLLLHTGENKSALSHLKLWVPYFEESGVEFVVMTRHIIAYNEAKQEYPHCNIVYAKEKKNVEYIINKLPMLQACFYPSNTGNNIHLLYETHVKHIFIGHGDSDKSASAHKFFRVYDENWVAGKAHKDRFEQAGFIHKGLNFVKVGRPNLYDVVLSSKSSWQKRFENKFKLFYLPTWEGVYEEQDYSSLHEMKKILSKVGTFENISMSLKLHPSTGNRDKKMKNFENELKEFVASKKLNCVIEEKKKTVNELIAASNIFVCDISAVVSECLAANAPIFVYIPGDKEINISKSNMPYEFYAYTFSSAKELGTKLNELLDGNDNLLENRKLAMEYILNQEATLDKRFMKELQTVCEDNFENK